jgi:hypothetical protein
LCWKADNIDNWHAIGQKSDQLIPVQNYREGDGSANLLDPTAVFGDEWIIGIHANGTRPVQTRYSKKER